MTTKFDLPAPSSEQSARSDELLHHLHSKIQQTGSISFADYMSEVLYHPNFGYYTNKAFSLGKTGDFVTAPELSPLFAQCIGQQAHEIMLNLPDAAILELGAGTGKLTGDLLQHLQAIQSLPKHYYIYEISPVLREKQRDYIQNNYPQFIPHITWLKSLPTQFTGVIIANEVLDAIPFECFRVDGKHIVERRVTIENNQLTWQLSAASGPLLSSAAARLKQYELRDGYESEIHLQQTEYVRALASLLEKGVILLADYGYGQMEYYHPERRQGTLTCFYQHHHHANPLILPGLQDITAHVDFTNVIETAFDAGCELGGYTTQAAFLFAMGLMTFAETIEKTLTEVQAFDLHQAIKLLTLPTEMGERIKFMALCKQYPHALSGFKLQDRRREL